MKKHGFTLIEVMISVAIVGILLSIIIPACTNYKASPEIPEQAQESEKGRSK